MAGRITLTMIKPDAVAKNYTGSIVKMIGDAGFRIAAMKLMHLTPVQAARFYEVHKGKPFYEPLVAFMSSGPIVAALLEKENAIADFRELIGATNPANAAPGTVRARLPPMFSGMRSMVLTATKMLSSKAIFSFPAWSGTDPIPCLNHFSQRHQTGEEAFRCRRAELQRKTIFRTTSVPAYSLRRLRNSSLFMKSSDFTTGEVISTYKTPRAM